MEQDHWQQMYMWQVKDLKYRQDRTHLFPSAYDIFVSDQENNGWQQCFQEQP